MPLYAYESIARSGSASRGRIEADSEAHARAILKSRAEVVVRLRETRSAEEVRSSRRSKKRPSPDEVATTVRQVSILVRAGVPLVEGLRSLAEQTKTASLRSSLEQMASEVSQGAPLSQSLSAQTRIFPPLAAQMAGIAEAGGNLAESMSRLADHLEKSAEIRRKVRSALAYPAVVVCISVFTVVILVTFILPRFMKLFGSMGAQIPWSTKALMAVSNAAVHQWYIFLAATALAAYLIRKFIDSPSGRRRIDMAGLKLPVIGDIVSKIVLSRVLASMSTLLASGVPMVQTLETSAAAADNQVVEAALLVAKRHVAEGESTSDSLKHAGIFPPLVLQMVASGEKTGELPMMLEHVCHLYNQDTDVRVRSLTSIIEPILIVFLGTVVGFIAISVILPIYSLIGAVK